MIHDRTCRGGRLTPGLSHAWSAGRLVYQGLGRLDAAFGASNWGEALNWLAGHGGDAPIAEVQFWGHGRWGNARLGDEILDITSLQAGHRHRAALELIRRRMLPGAAGLWWFRTCETFGTATGQSFASAWARFLGCRAAGHTYVIGFWQSGLHSLLPGEPPAWPAEEGLPGGEGARSVALRSHPGAPNTISCLRGRIPSGF
jgi:hypothetical protein